LLAITSVFSFSNSFTLLTEQCVEIHNEKRALHKDTPPVVWDDKLAKSAQEWADGLASSGNFQHSRGDYGENLYMHSRKDMENPCAKATESW